MMHLQTTRTPATGTTATFRESDLLAIVPHLRAFARFLSGDAARADDLVQDAIVHAMTAAHQFQTGTNLKAWLFTILRNLHYNELRKNRVRLRSLAEAADPAPARMSSQEACLAFGDFRRAFSQLGEKQREALILVGATGLSYEEAARVCNCALGTIKSRVSRARSDLLRMLEEGFLVQRRHTPAMAGRSGDVLDGWTA